MQRVSQASYFIDLPPNPVLMGLDTMTIAWGQQERRDAIALIAIAACFGLFFGGLSGFNVPRMLSFFGFGLIAAIFVAGVWFLVPGRRISDYVARLVLLNMILVVLAAVLIYVGSSQGAESVGLVVVVNVVFVLANIMFFCLALYRYMSGGRATTNSDPR